MQVYGPTHLHSAQSIGAPHAARVSQAAAPTAGTPIQDELQISDAARLVEQTHDLPEIRQDRINEIRNQIASGSYETEEKMGIAIGRLLDEMG